jgi:hypothetical protein
MKQTSSNGLVTTCAISLAAAICLMISCVSQDADIAVSAILTPYDANTSDISSPDGWTYNYGKTPEIIVAANGEELDILAQDYNPDTQTKAVLLHLKNGSAGYQITQALTDLPMLDRIMGLANDKDGNRYYATGADEAAVITPQYPPANTYRENIVRIVKVDRSGKILFNVDLDQARRANAADAEMIINPMVASTSRLAITKNEVALLHGINTGPDFNIGGARHQKALSTRMDASTGKVTKVSSIWCSHSFDQRLFVDGDSIIEYHLGDAFPRQVVFAKNYQSYPVLHIAGNIGDNATHTRLGNIALIEGDPSYRYLALLATKRDEGSNSTLTWQ